ncbi:hypothetical protein ACLKA7_004632 [Drosophila subpalustris]
MVTIDNICFCVPLRWGMLIIAVLDTILDVVAIVALCLELKSWKCDIETTSLIYGFHLIACMFLLISIWEQKTEFITPYMMSAVFRIIKVVRFTIYAFIDAWLFVAIIHSIILIFGLVFLVCVYFWYSKLKNES